MKPKHDARSLKAILNTLEKHDTKNIPFDVVIEAFSGYKLEEINLSNSADKKLITDLKSDLDDCIQQVKKVGGIQSRRINEVGNKMEQPVIDAINNSKSLLHAQGPKTQSGKGKSTGYPDILIKDSSGQATYLEVKTYNADNKDSTLRAFYLSPSDDFKVTQNARHLLVGFEMKPPSGKMGYVPTSFKLIDLAGLVCRIKFEISASNKDLYANSIML